MVKLIVLWEDMTAISWTSNRRITALTDKPLKRFYLGQPLLISNLLKFRHPSWASNCEKRPIKQSNFSATWKSIQIWSSLQIEFKLDSDTLGNFVLPMFNIDLCIQLNLEFRTEIIRNQNFHFWFFSNLDFSVKKNFPEIAQMQNKITYLEKGPTNGL